MAGGRAAEVRTRKRRWGDITADSGGLPPVLEQRKAGGGGRPADSVRLRPPLPRPGKILCCIGNYWEHAQREPRPLNMFMKNPEAVIGPDDTIILPKLTDPWIFMHQAELALIIKVRAKKVKRAGGRDDGERRRCLEAQLGEGRVHGGRFDQPRSGPPPPPAGLKPLRRRGRFAEADERPDLRGASFETAASRPPQDEELFLMPSTTYLMLRSAPRARLEARENANAARSQCHRQLGVERGDPST